MSAVGFDDATISKFRNHAKARKFSWSIDDRHPSYRYATLGNDTNYAVAAHLTANISTFVRERATSLSVRSMSARHFKHIGFRSYGRAFVWQLPDHKELHAYIITLNFGYPSVHILVQIHDPETGLVSTQPLTLKNRDNRTVDLEASPKHKHGLFKISHLRSDNEYEIAIRQVHRNGTDAFERYYSYHRIDEELNLVPVVDQIEQCYYIARKWVYSTIKREQSGGIIMEYFATREPYGKDEINLGWRRFQWNARSGLFELNGSENLYREKRLEWVLDSKIFPELAPTNAEPSEKERQFQEPTFSLPPTN